MKQEVDGMEKEIQAFIAYLHNTKKTSANTEVSYQRDLKKMSSFFLTEESEESRTFMNWNWKVISVLWKGRSLHHLQFPEVWHQSGLFFSFLLKKKLLTEIHLRI